MKGVSRRVAAKPDEARDFRKALSNWFRRVGLDYPWRRTEDPYAILVSEIMLQQTQIATVIGPKKYYLRWMDAFPTPEVLAAAEEEEVLRRWEGLGYYRRARSLQKAARVIVEDFGGEFPQSIAEILKLPGVGRYTAGAVASFAFDEAAPLVDANVARVFARLNDFREPIDGENGVARSWEWAEAQLKGARGGRTYNSALMELGQRVCTPVAPTCGDCPVRGFCRAKDPEALPVKRPCVKVAAIEEHVVFVERENEILLAKEPEGRRREGLWRLPGREEPVVCEMPLLLEMKYSITRYRVTLRVYGGSRMAAGDGERWVAREEIAFLPMGSPYRKAFERLEAGVDFQAPLR